MLHKNIKALIENSDPVLQWKLNCISFSLQQMTIVSGALQATRDRKDYQLNPISLQCLCRLHVQGYLQEQ